MSIPFITGCEPIKERIGCNHRRLRRWLQKVIRLFFGNAPDGFRPFWRCATEDPRSLTTLSHTQRSLHMLER
jgi:hypothetical protein